MEIYKTLSPSLNEVQRLTLLHLLKKEDKDLSMKNFVFLTLLTTLTAQAEIPTEHLINTEGKITAQSNPLCAQQNDEQTINELNRELTNVYEQTPNPIFTGPNDQKEFNNLKLQYPCNKNYGNGPRVNQSFTILGESFDNFIYGQLIPGIKTGNSVSTYFGANPETGNLIYLNKISSKDQVSYNVTISFCPFKGQYGTDFIGGSAELSNFFINTNIINFSSCKSGEVNGSVGFNSSTAGHMTSQFLPVKCNK